MNVLVVDDDPSMLRLVASILSAAGYSVSQAHNGRQALEMVLSAPPDLIICDWDMPEMNGVELCAQIRNSELPHYTYFILLTGKSRSEDVLAGLASGADDFITKPIDRATLHARTKCGVRVVRMEQQLRHISQYDSLTGVLNRRTFHEYMDDEWKRAIRYHRQLSCVMVDLDFFKRINDTYGHAAGDSVLVAVANILKRQVRSSDFICRYGGEEFLLLLTETNEEDAAQWADRTRIAISDAHLPVGNMTVQVTTSLGVAERLEDTANPAQLFELADQALTHAKQSGRNRVVRFGALNDQLIDPRVRQATVYSLDSVLAGDVMSVATVCPNQGDCVRNVADQFLQLRLESAPVVDDEGSVVGIISDTDLLTSAATLKGWGKKVSNVMRTDVVCYEEDTPVRRVYQFLSRVAIPRVVIVNQGQPTGVISRRTLLRWLWNWEATHAGATCNKSWATRENEHARLRTEIIMNAQAAERQAAHLRRRLVDKEDDDFIPSVIGEATKLQSLVNDMLGHCRAEAAPW